MCWSPTTPLLSKAPHCSAKETLGEGLLTSEGDFHRRQRRLAQPAFHPNRVATYGAMMADIANRAAGECATASGWICTLR